MRHTGFIRTFQAVGFACGLTGVTVLSGCAMAPPEELSLIAPDLSPDATTDPVQDQPDTAVVDVTQAPGVAPIVLGTLQSQAAVPRAASEVQSRLAGVAEQQAGYLPELSAGVVSDLTGDESASPEIQLTGSQTVYDFGRTGRNVSRQVLLTQKAHLDFLDTVDTELAEMLTLVADYESQLRQLALGQARLARMESLRALVEDRISAGATASTSMIDADRRVQTAQTLVLRAELAVASTAREISLETDQVLDSNGAGIALDRLQCDATALDDSRIVDVKKAQADLAIADLDLVNAQRARLPTLSLQASTGLDLADTSQAGDVEFGLRLNTVVFQGGAVQSRAVAASNTAAAAEANLTNTRQSAQRRYANAQDAIATQRVLARAVEAQLDMLDQSRDLYLSQFVELGTKTIDDVLTLEEEYHQTLLDLEMTRSEIVREQINCLAAAGGIRAFLGIENAVAYGLMLRQ